MFKRNWRKIGDFEKKQRRDFLKKLTAKGSFKIFKDLYAFSYNILGKKQLEKMDEDKIQLLSRVHSMFNKVKA